jgi:4-carboxymuconolactone decarboxylase
MDKVEIRYFIFRAFRQFNLSELGRKLRISPVNQLSEYQSGNAPEDMMDTEELYQRGLKLRKDMFGDEAVEARMSAFGEFGKPLQAVINAYAYGDVWHRPALPLVTKCLVMVAMMAAAGRGSELRVHLKGALNSGCTAEQIQDILLLVAMYCGIPAANEAHRAAADVFGD